MRLSFYYADALLQSEKHGVAEVLILARGGGSLEDLFCFNDPRLAYAIFNCSIPIVSGIGHETDTTIADLVSDLRAPTPSVAAEFVTPDGAAYKDRTKQLYEKLSDTIHTLLQAQAQQIDLLQSRLQHPKDRIEQLIEKRQFLTQKLITQIHLSIRQSHYRFDILKKALHTLSPLATLTRGYAIVSNHSGEILYNTKDIGIEDKLNIQLSTGRLACSVLKITCQVK